MAGVNVYQGALTVYNFNGDARSAIRASLTNVHGGKPQCAGHRLRERFSDNGGWAELEKLTTGVRFDGSAN